MGVTSSYSLYISYFYLQCGTLFRLKFLSSTFVSIEISKAVLLLIGHFRWLDHCNGFNTDSQIRGVLVKFPKISFKLFSTQHFLIHAPYLALIKHATCLWSCFVHKSVQHFTPYQGRCRIRIISRTIINGTE